MVMHLSFGETKDYVIQSCIILSNLMCLQHGDVLVHGHDMCKLYFMSFTLYNNGFWMQIYIYIYIFSELLAISYNDF